MAVALDILKKKTWFDDTMAQQALDVKNREWIEAFKQFVTKNKPVQTTANPPVTPPNPTPTGQTMQGVNGETFQLAPTNPQTGLSQPTQPVAQPTQPVQPATATQQATTTPTTAPTTPQTATQPTAQDKTAEIQAKNQAQMELNKQKSQLAIEERKRQAEEAKQASIPTDEKWVLNTLISGGSVAPQNTQAFRNAQFKYKNYQKFNSMSPTQLLDNMKMGEIDTETSQLLASNPNYIKAKEDFDRFQKNQSINNMVRSTYGWATGKTEEVDYYGKSQSEVAKRLGVTETNAEAFARIVSWSPLVAQLTQTVSNTAKQLNELNKERNNVYADLKKQYPDLSASAIMTLMGQRTQGLTDQINALNSTLTLTQADLKNAMEMAKLEYEAVSEDIEWQMKIASEQRAMENSLALSQMQFDQKIKQQAEMMNDPTQAINSVIAQYADQGIMASTSAQQHIAEFMKQNREKGTTLGQYISQMQKDFQAKPEYKAKFTPQATYQTFWNEVYKLVNWELTPTGIKTWTVTQDWSKLDETTLYNQRTGELKKVSASEASSYWPSPQEVTPEVSKWLSSRLSGDNEQSWMVSNDYMAVKFPWAKRMGDSYESKVASVESIGVSDVPQVGGVFAMNTYNSNWHTWIVQSVDLAKWTFTATDANRAWSQNGWPVTTSTYNISDNFTFSKAPAWAWTIRPSDIDYFNSATATDKKKLSSNPQYIDFNNKKSIVMSDPNADIYEVMRYSQGGKDMGEERLKSLGKFSQGLSQVAELSKKIQETETWPIIGRLRSYNPYDANAQALLAEINATVPNIARGVYGEVGVLTDADIQNYAKTLPNIKSTEDTNKLVLAMTLKTMLNGFKWQIQIDGSAWRDVSWFVWTVKQYEDRINQLLSQLGWNTSSTSTSSLPSNLTQEDITQFDNFY